MDAIELSMDAEFAIHASAIAIQSLERDELEEAFIEVLHQKALDRQMFFGILKDHGIDADIKLKLTSTEQLS
tara:strand:- start:2144 stop:2359 length:216 start_codon:yes stop_codon:yes gene_type:complete